ncbi:GTPase [Alkalihalobacillus alcalophilus ATCC 27647 = CGMCC 1.3604]|uniref:GTPase n=1 Tax=Alkalihalobacillus alcalophilus ATCC 27647 = CGMCC 1.3604 TaxID=1218173 RepID=A0A094WL46_ALKAL|nr:ribosome biogenesis GTPase YqeH [Alkalihalobacillus alcalophilus]KGA98474.1 GTPase [Alkalihalobacillus alcalophilus ATCC 27647 = CGMCC 1.3604]MED1563357.1 ribosome biogenesis GTPase YqeH [Alkalihalobacillus alcalophilus]THG88544.1 GTPase [Alkalihalobacillus alcalophilus ATCC 27647 = CGMCC 1.3604]
MDTEQIICAGCGVKVQTEDREGLGYAPPSALERDVVICQRCFRLKHYNEVQDVSLTDDDFLKILNTLGEKDALIVKIVDVFDFNGSWLQGLHRFVGKNDVLLVANKVDLLPKSFKRNKLINWLKKSAKELGLRPVDVCLMSAAKGESVIEIAATIDKLRQGKDVYIVGATNVGKSTFINKMIQAFDGDEEQLITTSHFPGTTLDMIDIPLDDGRTLYDTPGIINHHQMAHYIDKKELKLITPKKEIKPIVNQLNEGQALFFGGLARLDFKQGERSSFVSYFSNELQIHRTKVEKADQLYANHLGELLAPPGPKSKEDFPPLVKKDFRIKDKKVDLVFSGLGFVTINGTNLDIAAHVPKGVTVSIRDSIISS